MTEAELARAIARVATTDDPHALGQLEAELLAQSDPEAAVVARQAALKRRRLTRAN